MRQAYEPDVLVVDVEEPAPPPRSRSTTQDLTLQIHHGDDGAWHRKAIGGATTACGLDVPRGTAMRHETYGEPLCRRGCFSDFELARAAKQAIRERADDDAWMPARILRKDHDDER